MLPPQSTIMIVILQSRYDSRGISSNDSTCSSQWRYADTDSGKILMAMASLQLWNLDVLKNKLLFQQR